MFNKATRKTNVGSKKETSITKTNKAMNLSFTLVVDFKRFPNAKGTEASWRVMRCVIDSYCSDCIICLILSVHIVVI